MLLAAATGRRLFSETDVDFVQAGANVIAAAAGRERAEWELGAVRESERSRIARDLHDGVLQDLTDALAELHLWHRWRDLAASVPFAVIDRPGSTLRAAHGPAATSLAGARLGETRARLLADSAPPAWVFLHGPRSAQSSTAIRAAQG